LVPADLRYTRAGVKWAMSNSLGKFDDLMLRSLKAMASVIYYGGFYIAIASIFVVGYELIIWLRYGYWPSHRGYDLIVYIFNWRQGCQFTDWIGVNSLLCWIVDLWMPYFLIVVGVPTAIIGLFWMLRIDREL
jgi:hypothetical protein